jgi:dolichyl-phosphate-mannose-protein mannosyltransferase
MFLLVGYLANFLPFSRIIRVMFLYHYFFALIYSLAAAVILLGILGDYTADHPQFWKFSRPRKQYLYLGVLGLAIISFLYFAPLSYGLPLTEPELQARDWLSSWR